MNIKIENNDKKMIIIRKFFNENTILTLNSIKMKNLKQPLKHIGTVGNIEQPINLR